MKARLQALLLSVFTSLGRRIIGLSGQLWKDLSAKIDTLDKDDSLTPEQRHEAAATYLQHQLWKAVSMGHTSEPPAAFRQDWSKRAIQMAVLIRRLQRWFLPDTDSTTAAV